MGCSPFFFLAMSVCDARVHTWSTTFGQISTCCRVNICARCTWSLATHVCSGSAKGRPSLSLDPSVTTFSPPPSNRPGLTENPGRNFPTIFTLQIFNPFAFLPFPPYFSCRRILSGNKYIQLTIYSYKYLTELAFHFFLCLVKHRGDTISVSFKLS